MLRRQRRLLTIADSRQTPVFTSVSKTKLNFMDAIKKKDRLSFEAVLSNQKADKKMCYARLYTRGYLKSNPHEILILKN